LPHELKLKNVNLAQIDANSLLLSKKNIDEKSGALEMLRRTLTWLLICVTHNSHSALMTFEYQLTTLAQQPIAISQYHEYCRHKPRFLRNQTGICYLNAAMTLLHKMSCYPEVRKFFESKQKIPFDDSTLQEIRTIIHEIMEYYEETNSKTTDAIFANYYDMFSEDITKKTNIFDACGGGYVWDVIVNLMALLTQGDPKFPVKFVTCTNSYTPQPTTLLEQYLSARLNSTVCKQIDFPSLLCIIAPLQKIQELYNQWKEAKVVFQLDQGFTFPEILDLTKYCKSKNGKSALYRLVSVVVEKPKHTFTIVRHGLIWYWCNDTMIAQLPDDAIAKASRIGQFVLPARSPVQTLQHNKVVNGYTSQDDAALPCIFLYERINN